MFVVKTWPSVSKHLTFIPSKRVRPSLPIMVGPSFSSVSWRRFPDKHAWSFASQVSLSDARGSEYKLQNTKLKLTTNKIKNVFTKTNRVMSVVEKVRKSV